MYRFSTGPFPSLIRTARILFRKDEGGLQLECKDSSLDGDEKITNETVRDIETYELIKGKSCRYSRVTSARDLARSDYFPEAVRLVRFNVTVCSHTPCSTFNLPAGVVYHVS